MRFNCGLLFDEKMYRWGMWHPYFAWLPTRVASNDCRWLEWIERKKTWLGYWDSEYRATDETMTAQERTKNAPLS